MDNNAASGALLFIEPYIHQQERGHRPWEKIFAVYNNHSVRKQKQLTTGTSLLNHSLGLAEARGESKKILSDEQKGEADHLSGATCVKFCNLDYKKGRETPACLVCRCA
ncbi:MULTISPECIES: hypothetical protein [Pantoea]|uniref:Uncharacterized protein n=2 Tax=Pantoea TaxID=53335 RepID=A0A0U3JZG7_9GAMM|nr:MULTISPECIES: hypothetical protein [Pantoea]ALV93854.1 hypothetical protein LK04_17560 [Pantoea vagans]KHJ66611.1 hypothetical protein QU24_18370 [Pantoea rodasii]